MGELKDERLVELSEQHNVAQFVSFSPGPTPQVRHCRIRGQGFAPSTRHQGSNRSAAEWDFWFSKCPLIPAGTGKGKSVQVRNC